MIKNEHFENCDFPEIDRCLGKELDAHSQSWMFGVELMILENATILEL